MAGNVSEWTMDVYRPLSFEDADGLQPFRGNVFKTKVLNSDGAIADKYDKVIYDISGVKSVSYTHLRAHETVLDLVCRLLLETKTNKLHQLTVTRICK